MRGQLLAAPPVPSYPGCMDLMHFPMKPPRPFGQCRIRYNTPLAAMYCRQQGADVHA